MKNYLLFILFLVFGLSYSQKRILFSYDDAGNQTRRYICLGNCAAKNTTDSDYKNKETVMPDDMTVENDIKFYPNPVREELYLQWEIINENEVISIELYSMTGQSLMQNNLLTNLKTSTINFAGYPSGYYNIFFIYKNGDKKNLKIVKQ